MAVGKGQKLNQLERALPEGLIVDAGWLEVHGYSASLRKQYVDRGWLNQPARGVYMRVRGALRWEQVVISLQTLLALPVSVGGRSALEAQGYAHYLSQSRQVIHLYADGRMPGWLSKLDLNSKFVLHNRKRFFPAPKLPSLSIDDPTSEEQTLEGALRLTRWGPWYWPLIMSAPERAILELIDELPDSETFHLVDVTMESMVNVSPRRMQSLLEEARSVKVKRLFFFFADRHQHSWLKHIDRDKIDLGKGKRMIVKGGKLDPTYQITVPETLDGVH